MMAAPADRQPWTRVRIGRRALLRTSALTAAASAAAMFGCARRGPGTTAGPATAQSSAQPQTGSVFVQRLFTDPSSFDIHQVVAAVAVWPCAPAYNQLLQFDPQDPDRKVIPDLADSYEIAPDGAAIVFKLHRGVRFHDGAEFTSEDVKANIDWITNPPAGKPSARKGTFAVVQRVETPEPLTARFVLSRPAPSLIGQLATNYMVMGAKADLAKGDLGTQLNGTGPFKLKSFSRGVSVELERFPGYWVPSRPYLDGLAFAIVGDDSTAFTEFLSGRFQHLHDIGVENAPRVERETGGKALVVGVSSTNPELLFFNGTKKPFDDVRVRQAVSLALDRNEAIQLINQGKGTPGGYLLPGGQWAVTPEQLRQVPGYARPDVAEAKKLLAAAGVTGPVSGMLLTRTDRIFRDMATYVQGGLQKALGWNLRIDSRDAANFTDAATKGQFDLYVTARPSAIDDPDGIFADVALTKSPSNNGKIASPETDTLFEKQSQTLDLTQRRQLVQDLELKLLNRYQAVGLGFPQTQHGVWKTLQNYKLPASLYVGNRHQDVWLRR